MNRSIIEDYLKEQENVKAYHEADARRDEAGIEAARNAHNALMGAINANGSDYANIYSLYEDAQERGNEFIDLSDVIWDDKVEGLIESFRKYGIERFTFSSTWSSAVETAWLFIRNGCRLEGMTEINGHTKKFLSDEYEKKPAYLFSVQ